jgi:hypothetical protein
VPARKFSTSTSALATRSRRICLPASVDMSSVIASLLRLNCVKNALNCSSGSPNIGGEVPRVVGLARVLDLDDRGTEVGQDHRAVGPGDDSGDVQDDHALQCPGLCRGRQDLEAAKRDQRLSGLLKSARGNGRR